MNNRKTKFGILFAAVIVLLVGLPALTGCKKKTETTQTPTVQQMTEETTKQTICPVMGAPIDKKYYTEYKGQKVYFCCPDCKAQFAKEPEKYLSKLPQFKEESKMQ